MPTLRALLIAATLIVMGATSLPHVPRVWLDFQGWPILERVPQPDSWGTDTIADRYVARVALTDPLDLYTKRRVAQTPEEAATWTREASSPYPPVTLLAIAAMSAVGDRLGIGYYGMVLLLAILFLGLSLRYFLETRWYLFPLLYLNFGYFAERFVHVQDGSYLLMLVVVMAALVAARARRPAAHVLMAVATTIKLSPIFYLKNLPVMGRAAGTAFVAILVLGLVVPYFVWENYLYIFQFGYGLRGDRAGAAGALAVASLFAVTLAYLDGKGVFDAEDRVGWALVPAAVFLALKLNAPRHLLLVLLVPDRRGLRNVAAAAGLGLHTLMPGIIRFGSIGPIVCAILLGGLAWRLRRIGLDEIRRDLRDPRRALRLLSRPS